VRKESSTANHRTVRPEPVEGLLFFSADEWKEVQGFDKLSPNGTSM
jgi:hypothetical protein